MFFADKLGKLPPGIRGAPAGGAPVDMQTGQPLPESSQQQRGLQGSVPQQQAAAPQRAAAPPPPAAERRAPEPAPAPEKKKKKGWFG